MVPCGAPGGLLKRGAASSFLILGKAASALGTGGGEGVFLES